MRRLARVRNQGLAVLRHMHHETPFDRVVVADADVWWESHQLRDVLTKTWPRGVKAVASHGINWWGQTYDTHALRKKDEAFPQKPDTWGAWLSRTHNQVTGDYNRSLNVQSAFGGVAAYDAKAMLQGSAMYDAPDGDCEHVALHRSLGGVHVPGKFIVQH